MDNFRRRCGWIASGLEAELQLSDGLHFPLSDEFLAEPRDAVERRIAFALPIHTCPDAAARRLKRRTRGREIGAVGDVRVIYAERCGPAGRAVAYAQIPPPGGNIAQHHRTDTCAPDMQIAHETGERLDATLSSANARNCVLFPIENSRPPQVSPWDRCHYPPDGPERRC